MLDITAVKLNAVDSGSSGAHFTAVSDIERSPFLPGYFLSIGGENSGIWREDAERVIFGLPAYGTYATCGRWSTTRPSVLFIGKADGVVDIWDFSERSDAPVFSKSVSSCGIMCMRIVQIPGRREQLLPYLAVGDTGGTLYLLTLSRKYLRPAKNEAGSLQTLFDRQLKRLLQPIPVSLSSPTTLPPAVSVAAAAAAVAAAPPAAPPAAASTSTTSVGNAAAAASTKPSNSKDAEVSFLSFLDLTRQNDSTDLNSGWPNKNWKTCTTR